MGRPKVGKSAKGRNKSRIKRLPWYLWLAIAGGIAAVIIAVNINSEGDNPASPGEFKAAIVDQLYNLESNQDFINQVTEELEGYGFTVDIYRGHEVDVDFYSKLPSHGYKLILFRAHSGLLSRGEGSEYEQTETTFLFTDEPYTSGRHILDQLRDRLLMARMTDDYPVVFAVNSGFIEESTRGNFEDTVIVMMGCSSIDRFDMAEAFVAKGASVYIGWNASVALNYVDSATIKLIGNLCRDITIKQALSKTMDRVGEDPVFESHLRYYPQEAGDKTMTELAMRQPEG